MLPIHYCGSFWGMIKLKLGKEQRYYAFKRSVQSDVG